MSNNNIIDEKSTQSVGRFGGRDSPGMAGGSTKYLRYILFASFVSRLRFATMTVLTILGHHRGILHDLFLYPYLESSRRRIHMVVNQS